MKRNLNHLVTLYRKAYPEHNNMTDEQIKDHIKTEILIKKMVDEELESRCGNE